MRELCSLADRLPAERDRYVDFLRVASIGVVIVWHWSLSVLHWDDGVLRMPNPIASIPGGWLATWLLQVVPVFFIVGGYVNLAGWTSAQSSGAGAFGFVHRRLRRLIHPVAAFAVVWVTVDVVARLAIDAYPGVWNYGRVVFTPLWFIAAYAWVIALTPLTARLHARWPGSTLAALLALIVVVDAGRFGLEADAFAWMNTGLVWVAIHQLGYFFRDGAVRRGRAIALIAGSVTILSIMTSLGPYPRSMVSVPGYEFSNMYPTTAAIFCVALLQVGIIVLLRAPVDHWLRHAVVYRAVAVVNAHVMTIFVWHMTALVVLLGVLRELGWQPLDEPTAQWWLQRPIWIAAPAAVLFLFVAIFGRIETAEQRRSVGL